MDHFMAAAMGEQTKVLLTLFIMLAAAKFMAELSERLRQPAVAGEILAGVLLDQARHVVRNSNSIKTFFFALNTQLS